MTKFPLIVSYYTQNTVYQLEVQNLIASCEKWGLEHHIEPIPSFGSWERNCCYKPFFLMEKMQQFKRPLFWVDADAVFERAPQWQGIFTKDLALRLDRNLEDSHPSKVITGSVYINATSRGRRSSLSCGERNASGLFQEPERTQEGVGLRSLCAMSWGGKASKQTSAFFPWNMQRSWGILPMRRRWARWWIAHYQASRRFKKIINSM